jgi:hypothetical protein
MSMQSFKAFAETLDRNSDEFAKLAVSTTDAAALVTYARARGYDLSLSNAEDLIAEAHGELNGSGIKRLPDSELEQVNGGVSALALVGGIGAGIGAIAGAVFVAPAALATGVTLSMVGFVTGAGVSAGGIGTMIGGAIDLIKGD